MNRLLSTRWASALMLCSCIAASSHAQVSAQFDPSWFERADYALGESSCTEDRCICGDAILEYKDTSFRPKDIWVAMTAERIVDLWSIYDNKRGRYLLVSKRFEPELRRFQDEGIGHPRKIAARQRSLQRDLEAVQKLACQLLNSQNFFQINYPSMVEKIEKDSRRNLSRQESGRLKFVIESLEVRASKLEIPREKFVLTSPIVTGTYKKERYRLPIVDGSWLENPIGVDHAVKCTETGCVCGESKRELVSRNPTEDVFRSYSTGRLASNWRFFLETKRKMTRGSKSEARIQSLNQKKNKWGCNLLISLHIIKVLNPNLNSRIESEYKKALEVHRATQEKCKKAGNCDQLDKSERYGWVFPSDRFRKLEKATLFYSQVSKDDHMEF